MVIRYTIADERVATGETIRDGPNWKRSNEETYNEAFRAARDERKDEVPNVMN